MHSLCLFEHCELEQKL